MFFANSNANFMFLIKNGIKVVTFIAKKPNQEAKKHSSSSFFLFCFLVC